MYFLRESLYKLPARKLSYYWVKLHAYLLRPLYATWRARPMAVHGFSGDAPWGLPQDMAMAYPIPPPSNQVDNDFFLLASRSLPYGLVANYRAWTLLRIIRSHLCTNTLCFLAIPLEILQHS